MEGYPLSIQPGVHANPRLIPVLDLVPVINDPAGNPVNVEMERGRHPVMTIQYDPGPGLCDDGNGHDGIEREDEEVLDEGLEVGSGRVLMGY